MSSPHNRKQNQSRCPVLISSGNHWSEEKKTENALHRDDVTC